ncbi:polyprenyl synthetase family protein [Streptomyces acidiscabies]|uniref:Polyprenyl synthetase family protein n=1 Tax=Streptomyces acidiscabies TaxID=42234 RepID=A0ABU4MA12_9ACTN|nr:polyprenyl synthetase family protein [Streptomyces acidiscabies]MDX3024941.1 polyprenyl synthetase family protein [Streptomyces acidiscabies]
MPVVPVLDHKGVRPLMTQVPATAPPDLTAVGPDVHRILTVFLDRKAREMPGPETLPLFTALRRLLDSGKRLRPQLCVAGWYAGAGQGDKDTVLRVAAALELFQACALIHDDIMDASDLRRGRPSAHRALAAVYTDGGGPPSRSDAHGTNAAILLGDLALVWSDSLLHHTRADAVRRILPLVDTMRSELVYGQYLDLLHTDRLSEDVEAALRVVRYKTAKYTAQWPLHIGAVLAGAAPDVLDACHAFALPLGEAFQLRDDLLGVFGDPGRTGKAAGDDLREGKPTVLMALALRSASAPQAALLRRLVGSADLGEDDLLGVRAVLDDTGARQEVENMITARHAAALAVLETAPFPPAATAALRGLATAATVRQA